MTTDASAGARAGSSIELRQVPLSDLDLALGRLRRITSGAVRHKCISLREKGQLSPLIAAAHEDGLILVDGFARLRAARELGWSTVLVAIVRLSAVEMKAQLFLRNRARGLQVLEECRLVRELAEVDRLSQVEIGELLERHKSWVCRRLFLSRSLSAQIIEDAELGLLGGGSLRRLALLSPRNQEELIAVARRDGLSSRETSALLELWRRADDPELRRNLIEHPREAIERAHARPPATRAPRSLDDLFNLLESLTQLSLRVERRIRSPPRAGASAQSEAEIATAHAQAQSASRAALAAVGRWLARAERPHES